MRFISTRTHGVLDYLVGLLLIGAPWILGFARDGAETWVPVILGLGIIVYSLMTRYELGVVGVLSVPTHLGLDALGGAFLAISPWLLGYADLVWVPHVLVGIVEIVLAATTQRVPTSTRAGGRAGAAGP